LLQVATALPDAVHLEAVLAALGAGSPVAVENVRVLRAADAVGEVVGVVGDDQQMPSGARQFHAAMIAFSRSGAGS